MRTPDHSIGVNPLGSDLVLNTDGTNRRPYPFHRNVPAPTRGMPVNYDLRFNSTIFTIRIFNLSVDPPTYIQILVPILVQAVRALLVIITKSTILRTTVLDNLPKPPSRPHLTSSLHHPKV